MVKKSDVVIYEEEKRKTLKLIKKYAGEMHEQRMLELKYRRESDKESHENGMVRIRIKTAEIKKAQDRKERFFNSPKSNPTEYGYKGGRE